MPSFDLKTFQSELILWGSQHFRTFPWRQTRDPYRLLIAEVLLHRTQAKQVVDVYLRFVERFPDLLSLHQASAAEIAESLKSLGLYWRVELIKHMVAEIMDRFSGQIPQDRELLLSLPGVGDYIASSLRCFGYGLPDAIVDTNVMRVITRLRGIPFRDSLRRNRGFQQLAQEMVDAERSRDYNFAILDLAYLVCRPKNPLCQECPLQSMCLWYQGISKTETLQEPDQPI